MSVHKPACRLCSGHTTPRFQKLVLGRYQVAYLECRRCHSLQTEPPYWLSEAYGPRAPTINLHTLTCALAVRELTYHVLETLSMPHGVTLLDWGAGNGILAKLLRDRGTDAYCYDRYVRPLYVEDREPPAHCDVISSFEVWEHFPEPLAEIDGIFSYTPDIVIVSTDLYLGQSDDWPYLHPDIGRHVFFYSPQSLRFVAERHACQVEHGPRFVVFWKKDLPEQRRKSLFNLVQHPEAMCKSKPLGQ